MLLEPCRVAVFLQRKLFRGCLCICAASDDVSDCLSYADISELVISHVEGGRFALVERVAEEIADLLLEKFQSPWVRIKVSKPGAVARAANVGVIIERGLNLKQNFSGHTR